MTPDKAADNAATAIAEAAGFVRSGMAAAGGPQPQDMLLVADRWMALAVVLHEHPEAQSRFAEDVQPVRRGTVQPPGHMDRLEDGR